MSTEEMNLQELESQFSEQESLRREKLVKLQEEGKDPFDVYKVKRTHSSKQVKDNFEELEGKEVTVVFDASLGSGGLIGYTGNVYAHTGVITNNSKNESDW